MEMTPALAELRDAAHNLASLQSARDQGMDRLRKAIRAADREGRNSRTTIIRMAGVARQTVYDALDLEPADPPEPVDPPEPDYDAWEATERAEAWAQKI